MCKIIWIYSKKRMLGELLEEKLKVEFQYKIKTKKIYSKIEFDKKSICEPTILIFDWNEQEEMRLLEQSLSCDNIKHIFVLNEYHYLLGGSIRTSSFLTVENNLELLIKNIRQIVLPEQIIENDNLLPLTKREKEILVLISRGMLNKEIANELNITERTVKNHISNLFKKMNVYDRTQAAVYAIKNKMDKL